MPRHLSYGRRLPSVARPPRPALERVLDAAIHLLLPAWCAGCERPLPWRPSPLGVCASCRRRLPRPPTGRCRSCAEPARPGDDRCRRCATSPPAFELLIAAWSYLPPIDEVVRRLKFGRLELLARDLAAGVAAAVAESGGDHDLVTAVPLHWRRRVGRGYDQAALIAAAAARDLGVAYRPLLVRTRATRPQSTSDARSRRANVAGAFRPRARAAVRLAGASVLLVDDVATTGTTLDAAARALRAGGARRVTAVVAALTPRVR